MSGLHGYDPARIVALRARTRDAIDELREIRCDDPLADEALRAVRLMCRNLEDSWLPLLDAIWASRAMVTWRRVAGTCGGALALSRLVEQFGATSIWTPVDHGRAASAERAARRLAHAVDRFARVIAHGGDLAGPWHDLDVAARAAAARPAAVLDDRGVEGLVAALDAMGQVADRGLLAGTGVDPESVDRTRHALATVLGSVAAAGGRDHLVATVGRSTHLAGLAAEHPEAFGRMTLLALTTELVAHVTGTGAWSDTPGVLDHRAATAELLHAVGASPVTALQLLADPTTMSALTTSRHLDDDAVEAATAAALSAPVVDPHALGDALEVLAELVAVTGEHELNAGARRGVALAAGAVLPSIAPKLDARLPIDVTVRAAGAEPAEVIRLGGYDELARLVGQVVDDDAAQLALGVVVGAFRADQVAFAAGAIADRPDLDVSGTRAQVSAALADVSRVLVLVDHAVGERDELLAFRHGVARAEATRVIDLLGSAIAWYPPATPLARRIGSLTTRGLVAAIGTTRPPTVPDTGLGADLAVDFLATLVTLPLHDIAVRDRLGLGGIAPTTWDELDTLVAELDGADDDERSRIRSRIRAVVAGDPDLDAYVESIAATSGDAALARP